MAPITFQKNAVGILVYRHSWQARLYLFSPNPRIWEVIIRKNAESGLEERAILRREWMRSYLAMLLRPIAGGNVVWDVGGFGRHIESPQKKQ